MHIQDQNNFPTVIKIVSFESYRLGVNSIPQVQLMQPDPNAVLEDGVIGGILNLELDPSAADEHM